MAKEQKQAEALKSGPKSKGKKYAIIVLILCLGLGGIYAYRQVKEYQNRPKVRLVQAEPASFNRTLNLTAQVEAKSSQIVGSDWGLEIEELMVKEGDQVKKGDPLLRYSSRDAHKQLRKAKQDLEKLEEQESARLESYQEALAEVARSLGQELGMSLPSVESLINAGLANFDLQDQISSLLPKGLGDLSKLTELGLNPEKLSDTLSSLDGALNSSQVLLNEMTGLVNQVANSGITQLSAANLYQLLLQSRSLYDQVSGILSSTDQILNNVQEIPEDVKAWIDTIRQRAMGQLRAIEELINQIEKILDDIDKGIIPTLPDIPGLPDIPDLPDLPNRPSESEGTGTGAEDNPAGSKDSSQPMFEAPQEAPSIPDLVAPTPPSFEEQGTNVSGNDWDLPPEQPSENTINDEDPQTMLPAPAGQIQLKNQGPAQRQVLALANHPLAGSSLPAAMADEGAENPDPAMLLALLQMNQSQGQSKKAELEDRIAGLQEMTDKKAYTVKAEIDGLVASLPINQGDHPEAGSLEVLVLDNEDLEATCRVGKADAGRLQVGQVVRYHYEDLDLFGEVTYKSAIATDESKLGNLSNLGSELGLAGQLGQLATGLAGNDPKVLIRMSLAGPDLQRLTIGFDITCEVEVAKVKDVLSIPVEALLQDRDQYQVYYLDENQEVQVKPIEIGLIGENQVEVKSGLSEGEEIIFNALSGIVPGQKVTLLEQNKHE